ncbi:type II secretion system F family protein [Murdochiella sp. Marseille-P8839]|nr:type II secretion system F family protein [Murdochiella sp. Marseille-P8839]
MTLLLSLVLYVSWLVGLYYSYRQWPKAPSEVHPIAETFSLRRRAFAPMGWLFMKIRGWSPNHPRAKKRRRYMVMLVDPYHLRTALWKQEMETMSEIAFLLGMAGPCFLWSPFLFAFLCFACVGYDLSRLQDLKKQSQDLTKEMENALTDMLTQFILSLRAGTLPFVAWKTIAEKGQGALYREMSRVVREVEAGEGLRAATAGFGRIMPIKVMHDFAELFSQSIEVGGADLSVSLERLRSTLYQERKREYALQAERSSQRMLFPSLLLFIGILLLVLLPMLGQR